MRLSDQLFYLLYRALLYPLARLAFSVLGLTNQKIRRGLELRAGKPWRQAPKVPADRTYWFHCASGEFEYAKPVITRLKARDPHGRICVTYFSPTFAKAVETFPGVDFACALPWDTPRDLQDFIQTQKPEILMIARTDTWPEMVRQAKRAGLRTLLFSATLAPTSGRVRNPLSRWMTRAVFNQLDTIFCVDPSDLESFKQIGLGERTRVAGDTRYDQVIARLKTPKPIRDELFRQAKQRTIICGSSWPEDEVILLEAAKQKQDWNFVLVPHEPTDEHLAHLENECKRLGLKSVRYSKAANWPPGSILLVDKIGILAELYRKGSVAFVGGSFRKTVHSVMEPLASGALTVVGPFHRNNREALEFKKLHEGGVSLVTEIRTATDFASFLDQVRDADRFAIRIRREIEARAGKSDLVTNLANSKDQYLDKGLD